MKHATLAFALAAAAVAVAGCDSTRQILGQDKRAPDEFAVYSRAPLSLPPDYGLRPPTPGEERPQSRTTREEARRAILRTSTGTQPRAPKNGGTGASGMSPGSQALLRATGALDALKDIRMLINRETSILAEEDKTVTERIMFWDVPTEYGQSVDAAKESKRIRENLALGKPINKGEVPVIERKRKALLEGLF